IKEHFLSKSDYILFDIGANIGNYSLMLSEIFGNNSKIYSFEPSTSTFKVLNKRIKGFNTIQGYNYGLSDKESEAILYSNAELSGLASLYRRRLDHFNIHFDRKEKIQLTTLDDFCLRNNIQKIDLLKIDVEGSEMKVLNGG